MKETNENYESILSDEGKKHWDRIMSSQQCENIFEYRKWKDEIPYLKFPQDWMIKIVPPFAFAVVRFFVTVSELNDKHVSVYLDCYNMLGYMEQPYWEIYPYDGDTYRCYINETDELIEKIGEALEMLKEKNKKS